MQPLTTVRVIELVAPWGQYAGKLLADLGAEVIKIEPPQGDPARRQPPFASGTNKDRSLSFAYYNTNKKSLTLDLALAADEARLRTLLESADVLVTTFDRGQMSVPLLEAVDLGQRYPGLVITCLSGFGTTGPAVGYRVSNQGVFAMSGQMLGVGQPEGPPAAPPGQMVLDLAAVDAAIGTLAALRARMRTGRGQRVDVAASEVLAGQNSNPERGDSRQRFGNFHPQLSPSGVYECRGGAVEITVVMPAQWEALKQFLQPCPALDKPEWSDRGVRARDHREIEQIVAAALRDRDQGEAVTEAQRLRLPCLPVHTVTSFMSDPHVSARKYFVALGNEQPDGEWIAGPPYRLSGGGWALRRGAPRLGEHSTGSAIDARPRSDVVAVPKESSSEPAGAAPRGPLAGIRVVTFSTAFAGPTLTRYLADYGAEVIKVESKRRPDNTRGPERDFMEPSGVSTSTQFNHFNRNKRGLAVDMSREEGQEIVRSLLAKTDVVADNFSVSVMKRWGLDYPNLRTLKPDIIMLDMQGLGQSGPHSNYITYGPTLHSYSGLTSVWGFSHPWFVDYVAAEHGVVAVLAALLHRQRTGEGMHVDLAQGEALAALLGTWYLEAAANKGQGQPFGAADAPHGCYPCREDEWCVIDVQSQDDWQALVTAMGSPEWANDARFATSSGRTERSTELDSLISAWTRERDATEVERLLQSVGVAGVAVRQPSELFSDPQFVERDYFVTVDHPIIGPRAYAGLPIRLSGTPGEIWRAAPLLGQDNDYVLRDLLQMTDDQIARLSEQGVLE